MFCQKCGTENVEGARFCKNCGAPLKRWNGASAGGGGLPQGGDPARGGKPPAAKKPGYARWAAAAGGIILAAVVIAGVFAFRSYAERRDYENYIAQAENYLEEMDYESAEAAYMKAIEIDPKKEDPYLGLADVYIAQDDYEKAEKIIAQGEKAVYGSEEHKGGSGKTEKNEGEEENTFTDKENDVTNKSRYTWAVEPTDLADDIYYIRNENTFDYPANDLFRQMDTSYAVIRKEDSYGLIGLDGQLAAELEYRGIDALSRFYLLERKEAVYDPEYQTEMTDYYFVEEEKSVKPAVAVIGDAGNYYRGVFYYCDGLHNTGEYQVEQGYMEDYQRIPSGVIPVKRSEEIYDGSVYDMDWYDSLESKYALCDTEGNLITDFIYDDCGSLSAGLLAVKKDDKWGYVNEKGEVVIPIEYDASWCYDTYVFSYDKESESERIEACYGATDGYVPLCKDGRWELWDTSGKQFIAPGTFEEIRPVYDGKCWVKKDGKWGVIELTGQNDSNGETAGMENWKKLYTDYVQSAQSEGYAGYSLIYLDGDDVPELYLYGSSTAQGDQICTVKDGQIRTQALGNGGLSYIEKQNCFCDSGGRMDVYYDHIYQIRDGSFVKTAEGNYGAEDNTNVQTDAQGNPIYQYSWDGTEMTKEEYEQRFAELFDKDRAVWASKETVDAEEILRQIEDR